MEQILIYGITFLLCGLIVWLYLRKQSKQSGIVRQKVQIAKEEGRFEPLSLHPHIDLNTCIGSGACVRACPEKDILGLIDGKATVINATSCVGHGACFHACPVEAITLRIGTEKRGVELPHVNQTYESNVPGIYIAGELGGMGLIKNSVEQGQQAVENIARDKKKNPESVYDLVIIGAGPAGISGALTAKKNGLNFVIMDQDTLGGTVFTFPRSKVVMTNPMNLPLHGKVKLYDTSKQELLELWQHVLQENEISILENHRVVSIEMIDSDTFEVKTANDQLFKTQQVLLAIGRRGTPRKLNIPGEELPNVAYRLLDPEQISGQKITIVGGGDSAVESAMLLMDQNEVTLSYRKDQFARIKPKNQEKINDAIQNARLKVEFSSNLMEVKENSIQLKKQGGEIAQLPNDLVYIFIGGELPTEFLKKAGIEIKKRFGYIMKKHK